MISQDVRRQIVLAVSTHPVLAERGGHRRSPRLDHNDVPLFPVATAAMLLIFPPQAKTCEAPAGIARLAGALRGQGLPCTLLDANLEGQLHLLGLPAPATDTWTRRAGRTVAANLAAMRSPAIYTNPARYQRATADINRILEQAGRTRNVELGLANYQDPAVSPLQSSDLLGCARHPQDNLFFPWFRQRLPRILEATNPSMVGFSLNYLSQAPTTFAMIGFLKQLAPTLPIVAGGGLITSWMRSPDWRNPFAGLIDHLVAGPGEAALLRLLKHDGTAPRRPPEFQDLPGTDYLAPGVILPYAASSGCYWNRCSFCPEKAEGNPYHCLPPEQVHEDLSHLCRRHRPALIHLLDNAIAPALMSRLVETPPDAPWYGFARVSPQLSDPEFCHRLRRSGCLMLKLGIESGDQGVLDAMDKGIDLQLVSRNLAALQQAGIATYVYLLFGTPHEGPDQARKTLEFTAAHHRAITFLNLAIFNMPVASPEAAGLKTRGFSEGDLSLYTDFTHPQGWGRREVRSFLDREFKRHPAIASILKRDPPFFTSNHAPFFLNPSTRSNQDRI